MIVLVASGGAVRQLLISKRTDMLAVHAMLQLAPLPSPEWRVEDGSWAMVDPQSKLVELAPDLYGDGASDRNAFQVRGTATADPARAEVSQPASHSKRSHRTQGALSSQQHEAADAQSPQKASGSNEDGSDSYAPPSPRQVAEHIPPAPSPRSAGSLESDSQPRPPGSVTSAGDASIAACCQAAAAAARASAAAAAASASAAAAAAAAAAQRWQEQPTGEPQPGVQQPAKQTVDSPFTFVRSAAAASRSAGGTGLTTSSGDYSYMPRHRAATLKTHPEDPGTSQASQDSPDSVTTTPSSAGPSVAAISGTSVQRSVSIPGSAAGSLARRSESVISVSSSQAGHDPALQSLRQQERRAARHASLRNGSVEIGGGPSLGPAAFERQLSATSDHQQQQQQQQQQLPVDVAHRRISSTLPHLVSGSHLAIVDARRGWRDSITEALLKALPHHNAVTFGLPQPIRSLALSFDSKDTVLAGLDGFWKWVLRGLHEGAPDLFPASGLPCDSAGFEEAFSLDRVAGAPPVVLVCSEAHVLADASSLFVSRLLGTLRDMGNERHRFFLHAVAMVGGTSLEGVDMQAYTYKMGTSFSNTIRAADAAAKSRSKASSSRASSSSSSVRTSTHRKTQPSATSSRARHHEPAAAAASGAGDPKPAFARKCYSSSPSPAKVDQLVSQFGGAARVSRTTSASSVEGARSATLFRESARIAEKLARTSASVRGTAVREQPSDHSDGAERSSAVGSADPPPTYSLSPSRSPARKQLSSHYIGVEQESHASAIIAPGDVNGSNQPDGRHRSFRSRSTPEPDSQDGGSSDSQEAAGNEGGPSGKVDSPVREGGPARGLARLLRGNRSTGPAS